MMLKIYAHEHNMPFISRSNSDTLLGTEHDSLIFVSFPFPVGQQI